MTDTWPNYCFACRSYCARNAPCRCCESVWRQHSPGQDAMLAYEKRVPGARHGALSDAAASYGRTMTIHLLDIASAAMTDEGIDPAVQHRIINAILYGGSNPADVELRLGQEARMVEYMRTDARPTPLIFQQRDSESTEDAMRRFTGEAPSDD
jgi:hypothetical protein